MFKEAKDMLDGPLQGISGRGAQPLCVVFYCAVVNQEKDEEAEDGIAAFNQVEEVISRKDLHDSLVGFEIEDLHRFPDQDFREAWKNLCRYVETSDVAPLTQEEFDAEYWFCNHCGTLLDELHVITAIRDEPTQCCKVCNTHDPDTHTVPSTMSCTGHVDDMKYIYFP